MKFEDYICHHSCCHHFNEKGGYRGLYDISQQQLAAARKENESLKAQLDAIKAVLKIK